MPNTRIDMLRIAVATALLAVTISACVKKTYRNEFRRRGQGANAPTELEIRVATPDLASFNDAQKALLSNYRLVVEPVSRCKSTAGTHIEQGLWTGQVLRFMLPEHCDYGVSVDLGVLNADGKLQPIYYATTNSEGFGAHLVKQEELAQGRLLQVSLYLDVTEDGKKVGLDDTMPQSPDPDTGSTPQPDQDSSDRKEPDSKPAPKSQQRWDRYEPDLGFHNMYSGVAWRIFNGFVEVKKGGTPMGSLSLVASCFRQYGDSFEKWSAALKLKVAHIYATAVTETGCRNARGSSDGLSSGIMQVTGKTCVGTMRKIGKKYSSSGCKRAMAKDADFSVQVGSRYILDPSQVKWSAFKPVQGQRSDLGPALDPPKVGAAYNAGSLKRTKKNRWRMVSTSDHIDRYVRAYNAFVKYTKNKSMNIVSDFHFIPIDAPTVLPDAVSTHAELEALTPEAKEGDSVFVGDYANHEGDFYFYVKGTWKAAGEEW